MRKNAYILKHLPSFTFRLDENGEEFSLPDARALSFEDVDLLREIARGSTAVEQGPYVKAFILKYAPGVEAELEKAGFGDQAYFEIYNAWNLPQDKALGESSASRNS